MLFRQLLPFGVKVQRWYKNPVQWTFIAGLVSTLAPVALTNLGLLHLTDTETFSATIGLNMAIHSAGAWINYQTNAVIGTKSDVAAAVQAPPPAVE